MVKIRISMINRCLKLMSWSNTVWLVYCLFNCHKRARWSNPILTFLIFHEIDFATNTPSVIFTRNIFGNWLYLQMSFYYGYDCIVICRVWYELFEKQTIYYTLLRVLRWEFASLYIDNIIWNANLSYISAVGIVDKRGWINMNKGKLPAFNPSVWWTVCNWVSISLAVCSISRTVFLIS